MCTDNGARTLAEDPTLRLICSEFSSYRDAFPNRIFKTKYLSKGLTRLQKVCYYEHLIMITRTHNLLAGAVGSQTQTFWSPCVTSHVATGVFVDHARIALNPLSCHAVLLAADAKQSERSHDYGYQNIPAPPIALHSHHWWNCP